MTEREPNRNVGSSQPQPQMSYFLRQKPPIDYNENRRNRPQQTVNFVKELAGIAPDLRPGWMQGQPSQVSYHGPTEEQLMNVEQDPQRC